MLSATQFTRTTNKVGPVWAIKNQNDTLALSNGCSSNTSCGICITLKECISKGKCDTPADGKLTFINSSGATENLKTLGCAKKNDLFLNDAPLWHTESKDMVRPGRWYYDYTNHVIYVGDDPTGKKVEVSVTQAALINDKYYTNPGKSDVLVQGFKVEKYASVAQQGAIQAQYAKGWKLLDNTIQYNHGGGARVGSSAVVRGNHILHNGQVGIGAVGDNITFERNELAYNHWGNFLGTFEAGGSKFASTKYLKARCNYVHHNKGPGLWLDINNYYTLHEYNLITDNEDSGIHQEISFDAVIRDNVLKRNGATHDWAWHAQVTLSTSQNTDIYDNVLEVTSGNAIGIVQQDRCSCKASADPNACYASCKFKSKNNSATGNDISFLSTTGVSGLEADWQPDDFYKQSNVINANRYHVKDLTKKYWTRWGAQPLNLIQKTQSKTYIDYASKKDMTITLPAQETTSRVDADIKLDTTVAAIPASCPAERPIAW